MKNFKLFYKNSILIVTSSFVLQLISLIFNIYISNRVSPDVLGIFQLIMVTYYFAITLASSGVNISCMKTVSEELALNNPSGVIKTSKLCIKISLFMSFIVDILFYANSKYIVKNFFHNKVSLNIVKLICLSLPLISSSSAIMGYFTAVRRVYKIVIEQFIEQISKMIIIVFLFNLYSVNWTIENICFSLLIGDVLSELISFIYLFLAYKIDLSKHYKQTSEISSYISLKRIFKTLIPVSLTTYIKSGISAYKQLIIPSSLEKSGNNCYEALGIYGVISGMAMPIIQFPSIFISAISSLLIPEFSQYNVKHETKKIKYYTNKLLKTTLLFSLFISTIFFLFSNIIGNYVYHNNEVGIYVKIFSFLIPLIYLDIVIDSILKGLNCQTNVMLINIIDSIVTTSFIFIFVPILGIKGYIISIFISEILNFVLSISKLLFQTKRTVINDIIIIYNCPY